MGLILIDWRLYMRKTTISNDCIVEVVQISAGAYYRLRHNHIILGCAVIYNFIANIFDLVCIDFSSTPVLSVQIFFVSIKMGANSLPFEPVVLLGELLEELDLEGINLLV